MERCAVMGSACELWIDIGTSLDDSVDFVEESTLLKHKRVLH